MKRFVFPTSIILTLIFFGFIFYQLFFVSHEPFPKLASGKYVGFFAGSLLGVSEEKIFISVAAEEKSSTLEFIVYSPGWGVKNIEINGASDGNGVSPLIIIGPETVLRFGGRSISPGRFLGKVTNVSSGKESDWSLFSSDVKSQLENSSLAQRQLLEVEAEESNLEIQLKSKNEELEKIGLEQVRLTKALSEGSTLEQKAENRFSEKQSEIDILKQEIAKAEKDLSEMQSSLAVARSITQRGRLTTMARESLIREFREVNYKLSGQSRHNDEALLAELSRAKEALSLQQELASYHGSPDYNSVREASQR